MSGDEGRETWRKFVRGGYGFWPWQTAGVWGNPRFGRGDKIGLLSYVSTLRSVLGLLTLVVVGIYTGTRSADQVLTDEGWAKTAVNVTIAVGLVPLGMIVTFAATRRGFHRDFGWRRWLAPLWRIVIMAVTTYALMMPIILENMGGLPGLWGLLAVALEMEIIGIVFVARSTDNAALIIFGGVFLGWLVGLAWMILYILFVAYWASRTSCWAGEFHRLLAPTVSAILVVATTIVALVGHDTQGVSMGLWLFLTLGGMITTLALAIAEHETLRRHGYRWRYGPVPIPLAPLGQPTAEPGSPIPAPGPAPRSRP